MIDAAQPPAENTLGIDVTAINNGLPLFAHINIHFQPFATQPIWTKIPARSTL